MLLARPRDAGEAAEEAAAAAAAAARAARESVDRARDRASTAGKPSAWHVRHLSGRRVAAYL